MTDLYQQNTKALNGQQIWPAETSAPSRSQLPYVFRCEGLWNNTEPLLDVLDKYYGHRQLDGFGGSYGWSVRYRQTEDYEAIGVRTLGEYLQAFRDADTELPYLRHMSVNRAMPELRAFINHPREFAHNWANRPWLDRFSGPEFFIGQRGTSFGHIHQDQANVHVGFVQLQGTKEFVLFPPSDTQYLEAFEGREFPYQVRNSKVRYVDLNDYKRFPRLRQANPQVVRLHAGQALFLPSNWWHTTCNLTDSVSYCVRIINSSNICSSISAHIAGIPRWINRLTG